MKTVILAGGFGTRISEESHLKPKPMIEIGGYPIIWHIMKLYSHYGFNEFIICAGYKQNIIKEWFSNYFLHMSDITFDYLNGNQIEIHNRFSEPWKVTVVDTGLNTMTGGRVKRIKDFLGEEPFFLTYGDGVADVNITDLLEYHKSHGKLATITAIKPESRFGVIETNDKNEILSFREKSNIDSGWINGGFMIMNYEMLDYINGDTTVLEKNPFESLSSDNEMVSYKHSGFWQCMDTLRDKEKLENLWVEGNAPWKLWND